MATHSVQTASWAQQLNITMDKYWPIIKYLVKEITEASEEAQRKKMEKAAAQTDKKKDDESDEDEGDEHEFILLKDFNSMCIRLYLKDEDLAEDEDELVIGEKEQIPA